MNIDDPAYKYANTQGGGYNSSLHRAYHRCPPRSSKASLGRELTHRGVPQKCAVGKQDYLQHQLG